MQLLHVHVNRSTATWIVNGGIISLLLLLPAANGKMQVEWQVPKSCLSAVQCHTISATSHQLLEKHSTMSDTEL